MAEIVDLISDSDDDATSPAPAQALPAFVTADRLVEDLSDHSEDERLLRGGADAKPAKRARVEAPVFAAARPAAAAPRPTAAPQPAAARPALVPEAQLPIKREWFEAICYGKKRVEFREASQYWRSRLLGKAALNVRLVNGRGDAAPFCVYETTRVELLATGAIPAGLAPAPGTAAHRELFKGVDVVIALHLGRRLALRDPKTGREERYDPSRASPPPPAGAAPPAQPEPPGAAAPAAAAGPPTCDKCGAACEARVSRSEKNPGRKYYKCFPCDAWVGWADDAADAPAAKPKTKNIGLSGASYADIKRAEDAQTRGAAERSAARNDGGPRGNVFGFDGKKGLKGVVSKEHERRDAQKFQGMSSLKKALKGKTSPHFPPAAAPRQPPPPRDADDLRQKRLARFG